MTIFAATVGVNLKFIVKISNRKFIVKISNRKFTLIYVFEMGDHPTAVKCLPIAAESFR